MRILVADSDPVRMDLYKRILEQDEHEILTAKNRLEASLAYKRGRIDVAVLDSETPTEIGDLVNLYETPRIFISKLNEKEIKALQKRGLPINNFDENSLRYAVNRIMSLEQAVA